MNYVTYCIGSLPETSKLRCMDKYVQHGRTTCLAHTVAVAYHSVRLAERLGISYKKSELIRGALLHDYFLYDWHDSTNRKHMHGFTHSRAALRNADRDFALSATERDIISKHMFPLTFIPPASREAWIVCAVDKFCSLYETFSKRAYRGAAEEQTKEMEELREEMLRL